MEKERLCIISHPSGGLSAMRKNKRKRVPSTKGFVLQTQESSGGQGWLYQAVRDISVQEGGQCSEPARAHLPCLYVYLYDYKAQFSILHSCAQNSGVVVYDVWPYVGKMYFKGGCIPSACFSKHRQLPVGHPLLPHTKDFVTAALNLQQANLKSNFTISAAKRPYCIHPDHYTLHNCVTYLIFS